MRSKKISGDFEKRLEAAGMQVFERGWLSANNVLFNVRKDETVLVDSGYVTHAEQTVALVTHALGTRQLDRVINTHLHSDHCGGNQALALRFGCSIDIPAGEAGKVDPWDEASLSYRDTGQSCPMFQRTGLLRGGELVQMGGFDWQAVAAPGHDPQSLVFYQPELELLISADALWENGFGVVFPELEGAHAFGDVRATLDAIGRLNARFVIPGHGAPFENVPAALERAYSRLQSFEADPLKHARYGAKVLIKFHLLQVQKVQTEALRQWISSVPYLRLCHERFFAQLPFDRWCSDLLIDLSKSGALSIEAGEIRNI